MGVAAFFIVLAIALGMFILPRLLRPMMGNSAQGIILGTMIPIFGSFIICLIGFILVVWKLHLYRDMQTGAMDYSQAYIQENPEIQRRVDRYRQQFKDEVRQEVKKDMQEERARKQRSNDERRQR